jgi:hypothetical protein
MGETEMKKLVRKFGKYNVISFAVMAFGLLLWLLTPLMLWLFDFDSDIFGALIFLIALVMWVAGFVVRKISGSKRGG